MNDKNFFSIGEIAKAIGIHILYIGIISFFINEKKKWLKEDK